MIAQGAVQSGQLHELSYVPAGYARLERLPGTALAVLEGDRIMLCGGVLPEGPGRGVLWALLSAQAGAHMIFLHRGVKRFLEAQALRRVEATAVKGFDEGCRWLSLLGFKHEGEMPGYGLGGETHLRFGRVWA